MKLSAKGSWLHRIGFRQLLLLTFSLGIILLVLGATWITSYLSGKPVEQRLVHEGKNLVEIFAQQSRLALLYQSKSDARLAANAIMVFPDIIAVGIFDSEHRPLYIGGEYDIGSANADSQLNQITLASETSSAWNFIAPVFAGTQLDSNSPFLNEEVEPERIGHVYVQVGKQALRQMQGDIFRYNLMVSVVLAIALLLVLLAISARITKPIHHLATIMERARSGEKDVRANIEGTREIIMMETAFNAMMDVLDARERDLLVVRDMALEAARVKGEFSANVSHELRTPLNGVLGMLELLGEMGLSSRQKEYVDIANGSAEALLDLIDDVLDFSKIDAGKMELLQKEFVLNEMLEELVLLLGIQAQKKDIDLAYIVAPKIPQVLTGDSARIRQVLINLLGNALKFTPRGEVSVEVKIVSSADETLTLRFEVKDSGIGMTGEVQSKIFDAFSQADSSTTRQYGGTGLGLAISRQLVALMEGQIGATSAPGHGSTFWFILQFPENEAVLPDTIVSQDIKVLVVDDSNLSRRYLQQLLRTMRLDSEAAASGAEALSKLRSAAAQGAPFDLVFIDEVMPRMHGTDLAHLIAGDPEIISTRIIMMINRADPVLEETHQLDLAGFLAKPIKYLDLAALIDSMPVRLTKEQPPPVFATPEREDEISFDGSRVLVVEDNRANQLVAIGMLERLGCNASLAITGRDALVMIARDSFDLVLMDCHMPEMDGYEVTAQIRQMEDADKRLPIMAMTANVQQGESEKCLAVGMDDYLAKPLKLENLTEKLKKWLLASDGQPGNKDGLDANTESVQDNIVDLEIYEALRRNIGRGFTTLLQVFIDDLPDYMNSLRDAVSVRDCNAFADVAHTIKGSAANFGAKRLAECCEQLELLGRAEQVEGVDQLLKRIITECEQLSKFLEQAAQQEPVERHVIKTGEVAMSMVDHSQADLTQQRILIVDDDRGTRFAMRQVLEDEGCRVDEAKNAAQALMCCERFMPDLILMDAIMPGMDGFQACSRIQMMPGGKNIPILIITALSDEASIDKAFASGAADYISKPVNFSVLRKRILRLLQTSMVEKHVQKLAYSDALTGLPNRTLLTEKLGEVISAHKEGEITAILFLDLDRFKLINDTLGHDAGDLLLKIVAERLQGCVRQCDFVSRFGGDEFTLILNQIKSYSVIEGIAGKIYQTLSRPFVFLGKEMHVSASIGISIYPNDGADIRTLLKNADIAMYRAKAEHQHFAFYEERMEIDVARRLGLENDLRGAVKRQEMRVYYQPQQDLKTGKIISMEALVRWQHPTRGLISPMEFIPLAEETGQIMELGDWVMETACRQAKTWLDQGGNMHIAVNIAARQLDNGDVVERTLAILNRTGLPAEYLELEITESTIMLNAEVVINTLEELKNMGVKLAIDDFGTGYSSLSYLKRFPINLLKIDREFVANIATDRVDADIVRTIIQLANNLNVKVLAEGVEQESQKAYLKSEGCDFIQGYLLGKPMPVDEIEETFLSKLHANSPV